MWIDNALNKLSNDRIYCRDDLYTVLLDEKPDLNYNTFKWTLYNLVLKKKIYRIDYNTYTIEENKELPIYKPAYSKDAVNILNKLNSRFSKIQFVVFESVLLNEFLNHQIAQNTIYVEVEKGFSSYVFEELKDEYNKNVLYKPTKQELDKYWAKDCIVVLDLITQSPLNVREPHEISIEKLLVDVIAEKSISGIFDSFEIVDIYKIVNNDYRIDKRKINRYANRRGKGREIKQYLEGGD